MSIWTAIPYVTGGFSLIAFISATIAWVRLRAFRLDETAITRASGDQVTEVLDRIAGRFHVNTASLTRSQKHHIVLEQLRSQSDRFRDLLRAGLIGFGLLVALTAFSLWIGLAKPEPVALPFDQEANGTAIANLSLPAQPIPLIANLVAVTEAHISDRGSMTVQVFVNEKACQKESVYKNWTTGPIYTARASCSIQIEPNTPYSFRAVQDNYNAAAHWIKLSIQYRK